MKLTHKIRFTPTAKQRIQLMKTAGSARYAYNWGLAKWEELYAAGEKPNKYSISRMWTAEKPAWAKETSFKAQQAAIHNLGAAYTNYFQHRADKPTFKKRGDHDSFYCPNDTVRWFDNGRVSIPSVGRVKVTEQLRFAGKIEGYTVVREADAWFLCVHMETEHKLPSYGSPDSAVGIDVGLAHVATASDGSVLDLPDSLKKLEKRKRNAQRRLDKAKRVTVQHADGKTHKEYSKNGKRRLRRLRSIQQRINNIKKDACHKWTTNVCKNHATIVVETLDCEQMREKAPKHLRRALATSMMSEVLRQIAYKAKTLVKAPQFFPSSQRCSKCGRRKEDLKLSDRTYICEHCGLHIDRDLNASMNLMQTPWVTREVPVERRR